MDISDRSPDSAVRVSHCSAAGEIQEPEKQHCQHEKSAREHTLRANRNISPKKMIYSGQYFEVIFYCLCFFDFFCLNIVLSSGEF